MAAEIIDFAFAESFYAPAYSVTTTGTGAGTFAIPAAYYRLLWAEAANTGLSHASPRSLLERLTALVAPGSWRFRLNTAGKVVVTYLGAGTGQITAMTTALRNIIGLTTGDLALTYAALQQRTLSEYPTHFVMSTNFANDTGWKIVPGRRAVAIMPATGLAYGPAAYDGGFRRTVDLDLHPKDYDVRAAMNAASPGNETIATPFYPGNSAGSARWFSPFTGSPGQAPPWTVADFVNTVVENTVSVCFGNFQRITGDTFQSDSTRYDVCCVMPDSLTMDAAAPARENWDARYRYNGLTWSLISTGKGVQRDY